MNTARIVVLTIALGAGGVAAYLASGTDNKPAAAAPVAQMPTVDVLVAKADIGLGQIGQARRPAVADLAGRDRQQQLHSPQRTARCNHPDRRHRSRARPSSPANRSASRSWSRPTDRASWPRSCPPACARSRPKSRRRPALAASSCPTTGSTSSSPSARRTGPKAARRHGQFGDHPAQYSRSGDRPGAEGKRRPERRGRQDRDAGAEAGAGRNARPRAQTGTLSLALRSIADINMVESNPDEQAPRSAATASTSFATAYLPRRRHRSDQTTQK